MDIGKLTERMMAMDDAAWDRHTNPWSGWTRVATLPVLTIAIWSRVWIGYWSLLAIGICLIWIWINPRMFPKPASTKNWMSRGVLGERIWLARHKHKIPAHHQRMATALNTGAFAGLIAYATGLYYLHLWITLIGLFAMMLFKLWFLDRMVWLYFEQQDGL